MGKGWSGARNWGWTLRRLGISAFVVTHMATVSLWVLPECALRNACRPWLEGYLHPTGVWQHWGMFAPEPMRDSFAVDAEVFDSRGLRFEVPFPRAEGLNPIAGIPAFRHSKLAVNLFIPDWNNAREAAAHHAVRTLALPASAYPVDVHMIARYHPSPDFGGGPADPMAPDRTVALQSFHFASRDEVNP